MWHTVFRIRRHHPRNVNQISDDRARRWLTTGTATVIKRCPNRVTFHEDCIHHPFDVSNQSLFWNQGRVHAQLDPVFGAPCNSK